jgi:excisionase family DNA binding protein
METPDVHFITSKSRLQATVQEAVEKAVQAALASREASEEPTGKDWLTNEEAMAYLGLSRPTLARYRAEGTLPYSKLGSSVYYKREAVERLLESRLVRQAA